MIKPTSDDERQRWLDRLLREGVSREQAEAFLDGAELNPDDENEVEFLVASSSRPPSDESRGRKPERRRPAS
jgi:hypothetical protein